tara:strand:- start:19119 stop:20123 length:1005 start_codon:yes stop_codon:yes gene_type:complete
MYDHDGFGALPILELGVARVDVFFVLSGFVLTHIYWSQRSRPFEFGDFMLARVARIYPLYLFALLTIIGFLTLALIMGKGADLEGYSPTGLFANLFMLQSTGLVDAGMWNFPAWAISAEFAGYLAFPVFLWLATRMKARPIAFLMITLLNVFVIDQLMGRFAGQDMAASTMSGGFLRGAAVMLVGVGARVAFERFEMSSFRAGLYAGAGAICAILAAINHIGTAFVALGGALIIMGLARIDAHGKSTTLSRPVLRHLGSWSYAIFILHVPIYMILKNGLDVIGLPLEVNALTSLGMVLVVTAIAWPVHKLIEEPCRKAIRMGWEKRRKAAPVSA